MNRNPLTHRNSRSLLATLALGLALAAGLAGCGGDDSGGAEPVSQVKPAAESPAAAPTSGRAAQTAPAESGGETMMVANVTFEPETLDFGSVPPNQHLQGTITLRNKGSEPVTIIAMKPSCKCTTVEDLSGQTLAPGESRTVNAEMEKRAYPGPRNSKIDFVFADGSQRRYEITSVVAMAVEADPSYINGVDYLSGEYTVRSRDGKPFRILAVNERAPNFIDFDPKREEPRNEYRLSWDISQYDLTNCTDDLGRPMRLWWVIETDRDDVPLLDLRVRHNPCTRLEGLENGRRWHLSDNRVLLGNMKAGAPTEFEVEMKWLQHQVDPNVKIDRVTVDDSKAPCDVKLVSVTGEGEDTVIRVSVTPRAGFTGLLYQPIRFNANKAGQSHVVTVIGRVPSES
jgi:hypothetical protein